MFGWLAKLLAFLYGTIIPSYGGSIVLFTLLIMVALLPLTLKSTRSMLAIQQLQPELKKLQARYKDDRQKLNEETMKFYQENKISPFGGCLPLLIQMPIFFVLYEVLLGLTRRGPYGADLGSSMACSLGGKAAGCTPDGVFTMGGFFDPKYISHTSKLFQDLSSTRVMNSFGLDLSQSAMKALGEGASHAFPYIAMVLVVVLATWYQQRQIQSRTPANSQNPQQQMMMQVMPIVFGFIYLVIPVGVVVYFLASGLFRIGQQALVTRTMYGEGSVGAEILARARAEAEAEGPKPKKKLREMLMPPEESRPQIGKQANRSGGATASKAGAPTSRSGGSAKGGDKSKAKASASKSSPKTAKSGSGASKGGGRTTGKPRTDDDAAVDRPRKGSGAERSAAGSGAKARTAPASDGEGRIAGGAAKAPSRKAPSPAGGRRDNKKKR